MSQKTREQNKRIEHENNEFGKAALKRMTDNSYTLYGNINAFNIPIPPSEENRRKQPSDIVLVAQQIPARKLKPIRHGIPTVPVEVDGKEINPEDLRNYDGTPLFSTIESIGKNGEFRFVSFTDPNQAVDFVRGSVKKEDHDGADPSGFFGSHIQPTYPAYFFEHINCEGARLQLEDRHTYWDLTEVWLGGILWWWTSWNDQVSSVSTTGRGVILYEHIHWGGSSIYIPSNSIFADLRDIGWNDRASSIATSF